MRCFIFSLLLAVSAALPARANFEIISQVFQQIHDENPQHMSYEQMAVEAIGGLRNLDDGLRFGVESDRIIVYRNGKMIEHMRKPSGNDDTVQGWADLTQQILEAAKQASEEVSVRDFEAVDEMLAAVVAALNDGSKYYKAMDLADDGTKAAKRSFSAYRMANLLYIKIGLFDQDTPKAMRQIAERRSDAAGVILDLRGCSGGSVTAMVEVADMFLDGGIIVSVKNIAQNEEKFYNAQNGGILAAKPLVVLVDADTASSAEALGLSLSEQERAQVIGSRTLGKATVQELTDLENGSRLALTTSEIFGPSGVKVSENGFIPDICTSFMDEGQKIESVLQKSRNPNCPRQKREKYDFDILAAQALLSKKL